MATVDNLFGYHANQILPIVVGVIALVSTILHGYQNTRYGFWRVTFFMFYGGVFYTVGWFLRFISTRQPGNLALYIIQSIFIYLAPPIYSAAEYNTLGRLMHYLPMHAIVNPNRVVYIFLFLGSLVEVLTAIGSSWMAGAQGRNDKNLLLQGATLISIAVVLQAVVEVAFIAMTAILNVRCVRAKMMPRNVRTMFIMLYGTSVLIIIRCVFRAVETFDLRSVLDDGADSKSSALLSHEWPLYVFETIPVIVYSYWLNVIHPGRFIPNDQRQYLDFDGKTERMGPGWIHKRAWYMFVLDPFDFVGMLTMKKREEFYLTPGQWPQVEHNFAQGTGKNTATEHREAEANQKTNPAYSNV